MNNTCLDCVPDIMSLLCDDVTSGCPTPYRNNPSIPSLRWRGDLATLPLTSDGQGGEAAWENKVIVILTLYHDVTSSITQKSQHYNSSTFGNHHILETTELEASSRTLPQCNDGPSSLYCKWCYLLVLPSPVAFHLNTKHARGQSQ